MTRWLLALVLLLAPLGVLAQTSDSHNTQAEAWTHCEGFAAMTAANTCTSPGSNNLQRQCRLYDNGSTVIRVDEGCAADGGYWAVTKRHGFPYSQKCASGTSWSQVLDKCATPNEVCTAKNGDLPANDTQIFTGQKCVNGCVYGARTGKTGSAATGSVTIIYGQVGYTGETCATSDPPPTPAENGMTCTAAGGGMTMCIRSDGKHCFSADGQGGVDTGQMLCWQPGETGEKSAGNVIQKREPGTPSTPTPPTPPPGETTTPSTGPTATTTTTPGGTTINTSVTNHTTDNGTDGPNQAGEPDDGSGGDDGDDGEGETGSGGEGCETPPVCSDSGSIGCATLQQVWRSRCSGNGNKVGGGECGADGSLQSFTCSGDEIACRQALIAGEAHCRSKKGDANADGLADALDIEGDGKGDMGSDGPGDQSVSLGTGMLDDTGFFGAPSCPTLGVIELGVFGSFDLDAQPWLCDLTTMVRWTLALVGAFLAFCIIGGRTGF